MSEENHSLSSLLRAFPRGVRGKELFQRPKRCRFHLWLRKIAWRKAWQPTPVFLPGEPPWTQEPGGLQSMGSQRVGHDWIDLAQQHALCFPSSFSPLTFLMRGYLAEWVWSQGRGQVWGLGDEWGEPLQMTFEESSLTNPQYLSEGRMHGERNMEPYISMWEIDSQWEFVVWLGELKRAS